MNPHRTQFVPPPDPKPPFPWRRRARQLGMVLLATVVPFGVTVGLFSLADYVHPPRAQVPVKQCCCPR